MNRWKLRRNTSRLILVLASLLALIIIVMTGAIGHAITPDGAYIGQIEGTGLTIGARNSRDRKRVSLPQQLRPNTILYVPGNRSWANLGFFEDSPKDSTGLLVQAGPSEIISEWSFPCSAKGRLTINWKKGEKRGCEEGVKIQSSSKRGGLPNNNFQASRRLLAQAEDEVTVVPTPGESLLQTADNAAGISINVLVGEVQVKSAKNPGGRLVKAGERYDYPQDTITPINTNPIVNSPEMQDFLNPNNWSSPDIPQRIADGFSEQLGEMRTALGKGSPAVASNSGNNNPRQSALPTPSNNGVNLNGEWTFDFGFFSVKSDGSCESAPEAGAYQGKITITQNGSQLNISPSGPVPMTNGNVSGNQFESRGQTPMRWVGTISSDGKKISGSGICGSVNMPFTMTRQGSQASSPTSSPGGSPPVITKFTCNGNNSSCTAAWKASNSLSISYTDDDGDASSWIVSGYTEGKSSSEGQILPANGRSSSIDTSVSCTCEGRGCSSTRTFPMRAVVIDATGLQGTASLNLQCQPSVIDRLQDIIRDRVPIPRLPF